MNRLTVSAFCLFLGISWMDLPTVNAREVLPLPMGTPTIALTAFDVNDKTVELRYKIMNDSNHDAWVCDTLYWPGKALSTDYEVYMDEDAQTLVVRRQIEVACGEFPAAPRYRGRYVLLRPGEQRVGSFSLTVPVSRQTLLTQASPDVNLATRVAVKIGVYNEDLPGKIGALLNLATKLGYSPTLTSAFGPKDWDPYFRYFPGFSIYDAFGGLSGFSSLWTEGSAQIDVPYMSPPTLGDESILQITVSGVLIPMVQTGG
jgi:hypothetical protein